MNFFGKLSVGDLAFLHEPIVLISMIIPVFGGLAVFLLLTYYKKWKWLWDEWITTVDHKKIGIMYIIVAFIMFVRGAADAGMMRLQQAISSGSDGFLTPDHFDQIFTAHGVIMIFFVAMPLMFGLINYITPLQIGARDVAFPFLNSLSFWLLVSSVILVNISLYIGEFAHTGWLAYPPLSEKEFSPGVGVDYYIWSLQISGLGTLLSAVNFFVTIIRMRCPGMTFMRMPIFIWTVFCSMILIMAAFPILTVSLALLWLDRFMDMHFFTTGFGGNQMMYVNLIWAWGHPEVYILVLPAFGIFSEVVATFCKKRLFGYTTMVWATFAITILSFSVWVHHFFTMGAGANVNAVFGIATMVISVPTGMKIFNWLFTMYQGKITYKVPMVYVVAFLLLFTIGGMTGVILSVPGIDFQLHNSLFLVAHFHNTIIGGAVFGFFAGLVYWFPKMFGFRLNERFGRYSVYCWFFGFLIAFIPVYILGMKGATRRMVVYDPATGWQPYFIVACVGAIIIGLAVFLQFVQLFLSIKNRDSLRDKTGDSWLDGRTLEWSISSPPPEYNFAVVPEVQGRDAYWEKKMSNKHKGAVEYQDIHMPRKTSIGFLLGMLTLPFGFAIVWEISWLFMISSLAMFVCLMARSFDRNKDYYISAESVKNTEEGFV